jgi:hypothetical protein
MTAGLGSLRRLRNISLLKPARARTVAISVPGAEVLRSQKQHLPVFHC